jgi:hypothetical protein
MPNMAKTAEEFLSTIQFRREMRDSFQTEE